MKQIVASFVYCGFEVELVSTPDNYTVQRKERSSPAQRWGVTHSAAYDREDAGVAMRDFEANVEHARSHSSRSMFRDSNLNR